MMTPMSGSTSLKYLDRVGICRTSGSNGYPKLVSVGDDKVRHDERKGNLNNQPEIHVNLRLTLSVSARNRQTVRFSE